jgi:hypothetical protein
MEGNASKKITYWAPKGFSVVENQKEIKWPETLIIYYQGAGMPSSLDQVAET